MYTLRYIYHFADDTNFLYASHSLKKINKAINFDLSNLVQWLRANKISLTVNKTELVIYQITKKTNLQKSKFSTSWAKNRTKTSHKVLRSHSRWNGILDKLRYYISADILKTIYYALFDSHMRYACRIWGQGHSKTFDMIQSAQNKALRIINFKQSMEPSEPLYQKLK